MRFPLSGRLGAVSASWRIALFLVIAAAVVVAGFLVFRHERTPHHRHVLASTAVPVRHPRVSTVVHHRRARRVAKARRLRRFTIGYSVQGRRIVAFELGGPSTETRQSGAGRNILVVGCIHGNEPDGIAIARRLLTEQPLSGTAIWIVPVLNPDGVAADTRQNGDGVDLNRNFPWHWRPLGPPGTTFYAGPHALSEPESRAAKRLILRTRPQITIWFHQHQNLVDLSGGDPSIERRFAALVGLPAVQLSRFPGSVVNWENSRMPGTTAFVAELPAGSLSGPGLTRYADAVLALAKG